MVIDFSYSMTFGNQGQHRSHRSSGSHRRKNGEIFADVFQGKLSEFALYNCLYKKYAISKPGLEVWRLGKWDDVDLLVDDKRLSIKLTKSFGQLLLLETKDWDNCGRYIPNINIHTETYDYFVLVRIAPDCSDILKQNQMYYSDETDKKLLYNILLKEEWKYDVPGFITLKEFIYIIEHKHIISKGALLNGKTKMDASNYYIQAGDMHLLTEL